MKQQPTTKKKKSLVHTIAEVDNNDAEKDRDEINKEKEKKKKVENMFVETGWTVRMSKRRMKGRKVSTSLWSDQCGCSRSQSAMKGRLRAVSTEKLATRGPEELDTAEANLIAGLTVKQDALAPCAVSGPRSHWQ